MTRGDAKGGCCGLIVFLLWLGINGAMAAWIYFYIYSSVHPNPRTAVNIRHAGWVGYYIMMFLFGFVLSTFNLMVCWFFFASELGFGSSSNYNGRTKAPRVLFNLFITLPIAVIIALGPFISPFIGLPIAQKNAWNHGCDAFPLQIILDAKKYNAPSYQPTIAQFFQGSTPLYTYDIYQSSADDWSFNIRTIDSPSLAANRSDPMYPSISNVTYSFVDNTFGANCTSSSSNTSTSCIHGSFNPGNYLSFNITDSRFNFTALRAVDKEWAFTDDAPSVILKDTSSGAEVVKTDVTKKGDCTQLKVCAGTSGGNVDESVGGAAVVIPMGLLLIRQMDYATECTTPSSD